MAQRIPVFRKDQKLQRLQNQLAQAQKAIPEAHMVRRLQLAITPAAVKDANPSLAGWYEWLGNWATAIDAVRSESVANAQAPDGQGCPK